MELNQNKQLIFQIHQKTFFLTPSKKYIMIEELKDEIEGLKNILIEIKKSKTIEGTRNKRNKE